MTPEELAEIRARAQAACSYKRSVLDAEDGMYMPAEAETDASESFTCPLCSGDGEIYGQRFDDSGTKASTIVAYGIGDGFRLAEEFVENAPEDIFRLIEEVERLQGELEDADLVMKDAVGHARAAAEGWQHVAHYFLGDYADSHSFEECRAEAVRRAAERGELRLKHALNHPAYCAIYDNGPCTCGKKKL